MFDLKSMTARLLLTILTIVLAAWVAGSALGLMVMQDEFSEVFDARIEATAKQLLHVSGNENLAAINRDGETTEQRDDYLIHRILNANGDTIYQTSKEPHPFNNTTVPGFTDVNGYRIFTAVNLDGSRIAQVADAFENRREAVLEASGALLVPLLLLIPASIFAIVYAVRRQLHPITTLRQEIALRHGGNLTEIDNQDLPIELAPIAHSVNHLIERVRATINSERDFASNSAHELRTPVAGALAQVQQLKTEASENYLPRLSKIEQSLIALTSIVEKLLQLHRSASDVGFAQDKVDIAMVARLVCEDFKRLPECGGRLQHNIASNLQVFRQSNADAIGIILRNLIENAMSHSLSDSVVTLNMNSSGDIVIENDADPLEPATLAKLTQRFTRGKTSAKGSGLGLAISSKLTQQLGGQLELHSPIPGSSRGFQAKLIL